MAALVVFLVSSCWPLAAQARETLKVVVAEKESLQYLVFWVAKGGGFFEREGIDIELVQAPETKGPPPIEAMLAKGEAEAAVLPPAVYLRMIANKAPFVIVANLFANDPNGLVVRRDVFEARKLDAAAPLRDRVAALKGAKIGVPPASHGRLRALFVTQGLDPDKDVEIVVLLARDQTTALATKKVDALFVATPLLERAVVADSAVVVVELSRGEIPELANRQTHVLAVTRRVHIERRGTLVGAVRAIAAAEKSIHARSSEAVDALARELPNRPRGELEELVRLYTPSVPETPEVRVQDVSAALAHIPDPVPKPDLAGVELAPFVATDIAQVAANGGGDPRTRWGVVAVVVVGVVGIVLVVRRRRKAR